MKERDWSLWVTATMKGGVTKTTSTMFLAWSLSERPDEDVLVFDADAGTQGVAMWISRLAADGAALPFHVVQYRPGELIVPALLDAQARTGARRVLVDMGAEFPETLRQLMTLRPDLVLSPVGIEQADVDGLAPTRQIVEPAGVPMHVLLSRVPAAGLGRARQVRGALADGGYRVLTDEVPLNRTRYADAYGNVPVQLDPYPSVVEELLGAQWAAQRAARAALGVPR